MTARSPIVPERVRCIGGESFAFIPHRLLRDGFVASMSHDERSLYLFLVLAADRRGVSYYGYDRICSTLEMILDDYIEARNGLIAKDLVAFDSRRFQVLSLPDQPKEAPSRPLQGRRDLEDHDPATIHQAALDSLAGAKKRR